MAPTTQIVEDEEILAIRQLGPKALPDESVTETESRAVEPRPPQPPSPPLDLTPLSVLGLSIRLYNALVRRDVTTVEQLARMPDTEVKALRQIGPRSLAEIQKKLQDYLSANPALASKLAETSALSELGIPRSLREKLWAAGIRSIEEVAAHSAEELLVKLGRGSTNSYYGRCLILLKRGLSQLGLALATKPPSQPLVDPNTLTTLHERGVPMLDNDKAGVSHSIEELSLSIRTHNGLMRTGIHTVEALLVMSLVEVATISNIGPKSLAEIREKLQDYLSANPILATKLLKASARGESPSSTLLPDSASTQAMAPTTQTVDIPTIRIRVSSEDSIEVLGLSARTFNVLMYASIRTIGELLQAIESQFLPWFAGGIGPKTMAEIEDSLIRVQLVGVPEAIDESGAPSADGTSTVRDISPLPVPEIQDQSSPPVEVLNLSARSYNCLKRADLHTVAQVAALSDEGISTIRQLGPKALADIREKLAAYLAKHPLPGEAKESPQEPVAQAVEPLPPQLPSPPPDPTPLDVLGLSIRPHHALVWRGNITTVEQLARMSDEEIRGVRNIGPKSLAEIQEKLHVYLSANPIPDVASTQAMGPTTQIVEVKVPVISEEVIRWQARLVKKQISAGLLHEQARIAGNSIAHWLSVINDIGRDPAYEIMAKVLGLDFGQMKKIDRGKIG